MKLKKKIKLILHHELDESIELTENFSWFFLFKKLLHLVGKVSFNFFYGVGLMIISFVLLPVKIISTVLSPRKNLKQLHLNRSFRSPIKTLLIFCILIIIAITPVVVLNLASEGKVLTGRVLGISDEAVTSLSKAQQAIEAEDYTSAKTNFGEAISQLETAKQELDNSSLLLQAILKSAPTQVNPTDILLAARLLVEVGEDSTELLTLIESMKFTPQGISSNNLIGDDFKSMQSLVQTIDSKLTRSNKILQSTNSGIIPEQYLAQFIATKSLVSELSTQMSELPEFLNLVTDVLLGNKRFLVVMQNNNELRPTGGFIGTIGQGSLNNGAIESLDIRSVYDLDGQLADWIKPPSPITFVNNRLFLRDSNWLADFGVTAKLLSTLYEKEGGETPDIVIAFNPDIFIDLLKITGPISLPKYNVEITAENFIEQIQTSTSIAYDKSLNQPKQLLADLYPALIQKLNLSSSKDLLGFLGVFQKHLAQKNILLYSRDQALQDRLKKFNWAGQIKPTDRDYLSIVSSNLGGTKTDLDISREVKLDTEIIEDGRIRNKITYSLSNPLPNNQSLVNKSFVRFMVPQNSKLTAAYGFSNLENPKLDKQYTQLEALTSWENSLSYNHLNFSYEGQESGKTFFGGWVVLAGGESKDIILEYELPFTLQSLDRYSLLVQKQSGMKPFKLDHQITLPSKVSWAWKSNSYGIRNNDNQILLSTNNLTQDIFSGVVLQKR